MLTALPTPLDEPVLAFPKPPDLSSKWPEEACAGESGELVELRKLICACDMPAGWGALSLNYEYVINDIQALK